MNKLSILLDRHFPYSIKSFNSPKTETKKLDIPNAFPKQLGRIYHVMDLYLQSFQEDVVLGNRRTALMLGLLYHVYKPKKISLIGYEIIFNFKDTFKTKLVKWIWKIAVRKIDKLVVMTNSERQYLAREFGTKLEKFKTIPFYAEDGHYIGPSADGYIFSAGRMERDFETLIEAVKGTGFPTIIVADQSQKVKLEKVRPANVKIYYNIPREKYTELLEKSKIVVVPLFKGAASRGQVVILEAMKFGKPIISSRVDGTVDYLEDGKNGYFVEPGQAKALQEILESCFGDFEKLEGIGKEAFQTQRNKFSPEAFYNSYLELIREECRQKNYYFSVEDKTHNNVEIRKTENFLS